MRSSGEIAAEARHACARRLSLVCRVVRSCGSTAIDTSRHSPVRSHKDAHDRLERLAAHGARRRARGCPRPSDGRSGAASKPSSAGGREPDRWFAVDARVFSAPHEPGARVVLTWSRPGGAPCVLLIPYSFLAMIFRPSLCRGLSLPVARDARCCRASAAGSRAPSFRFDGLAAGFFAPRPSLVVGFAG